jgi:hypothetical protein
LFDIGNGVVRGFSFQKVPNCDWHGPRSHINRVWPIQTTDQSPGKIVQIGIEDGGNLRPSFIVAKNLAVANYSDNLAGLRIDNIAVEHVFLFCVSDVTFTTPNSARCSGSRAIVRGCREMARSRCQMCGNRHFRSRLGTPTVDANVSVLGRMTDDEQRAILAALEALKAD